MITKDNPDPGAKRFYVGWSVDAMNYTCVSVSSFENVIPLVQYEEPSLFMAPARSLESQIQLLNNLPTPKVSGKHSRKR